METNTKRRFARVSPGLVALLIGGCAAEIPIEAPDITDEQVQAKAHSIVPLTSSRGEVQALLGKPWLASDAFGLEVYRDTDTQHQVLLVFAPYPVPVPMPANDFEAYTLVSYDRQGYVTGVDAAIAEDRFSAGRPSSLSIEADDMKFSRVGWKNLLLSIPLERYLDRRTADSRSACTVLIGCKSEGVCWTSVEVDGKGAHRLPIVELTMPWGQPLDQAVAQDATPPAETRETCAAKQAVLVNGSCVSIDSLVRRQLVPVELKPGHHQLTFTRTLTKGKLPAELQCAAGEIVYATLGGTVLKQYTFAQQLQHGLKMIEAEGTVIFSAVAPGGPAVDSVAIYYDDAWLVSH
jgi:hypothetical protein